MHKKAKTEKYQLNSWTKSSVLVIRHHNSCADLHQLNIREL